MDSLNDEEDGDGFSRAKLTQPQRLSLVERDLRSHARSLSGIVTKLNGGFTEQQMDQLHNVVREELADIGIRLDGPDHVDDMREDMRFVRRLRLNWDNASKKAGNFVLMGGFAVIASIIGLGFWAWIRRGTGQ